MSGQTGRPRAAADWSRLEWESWATCRYPAGMAQARADYPRGAMCYCESCLPDFFHKGTRQNPIQMDLIDCAIALEKGWPRCSDHGTMKVIAK